MTKRSLPDARQLKARRALEEAVNFERQGFGPQADEAYARVVRKYPEYFDALHLYGLFKYQQGQFGEALKLVAKATQMNPRSSNALNSRGVIQGALHRHAEALASFDAAVAVEPGNASALTNRANSLNELRRYQEAIDSTDRALAIDPQSLDAYIPRGSALLALRQRAEALDCYDRLLKRNPAMAMAWVGRGNALAELARFDEALAAHRQALNVRSDLLEAWLGCARVFSILKRYPDAIAAYRRAGAVRPDSVVVLAGLASVLVADGKVAEALKIARAMLATGETPELKALIAECLCSSALRPGDGEVGDPRDLLLRAMTEPWGAPRDMAPNCIRFLALNPAIQENSAKAVRAWPRRLSMDELSERSGLTAIAEDRLLRALLESAPVCDVSLERLLTGLRLTLLTAAHTGAAASEGPVLDFYCALARQCFINDYVFVLAEGEAEAAIALRETLLASLESGAAIAALLPVAVAAYFPLHTLAGSERLLERQWPSAVEAVLRQQVREPLEERRLRSAIPVLTPIEDAVSVEVRKQYEEHPYPKWVKLAPIRMALSFDDFMRQLFPLQPIDPIGKQDAIDILVAGCGTGAHLIVAASRFGGSRLLAVDLSLTSLGYAQRQANSLGFGNVEFAQADIMKLGSIGRSFDVIESVGVLHHLADPFGGWRILLSLLRPNGLMRLGFYSEIGRRFLAPARDLIAARGYRPGNEDIRRFRQDLLDSSWDSPARAAASVADFFSLSECRDLLFHVQEHRLTLPQIANFLAENNLRFLGFEIDAQTAQGYARQFPADAAMTGLMQWHQYETGHPRTFAYMYNFWVQKAGSGS
jgi:tetratricopeptide (TPR) repeat protein/SAM-dependent methyltransferase